MLGSVCRPHFMSGEETETARGRSAPIFIALTSYALSLDGFLPTGSPRFQDDLGGFDDGNMMPSCSLHQTSNIDVWALPIRVVGSSAFVSKALGYDPAIGVVVRHARVLALTPTSCVSASTKISAEGERPSWPGLSLTGRFRSPFHSRALKSKQDDTCMMTAIPTSFSCISIPPLSASLSHAKGS
jgi:hypothetical protein